MTTLHRLFFAVRLPFASALGTELDTGRDRQFLGQFEDLPFELRTIVAAVEDGP